MAARETKPNGKSQLIRDLKNGEFATLYIISGEESYMKEYYLRQLRQKVVDETFADFNLIEFEGKGLTPEMLTEAIDSYPAMADKKLIIVKDFDLFKPPAGFADVLPGVLGDLPEYVCLVFYYDGQAHQAVQDTREARLLCRVRTRGGAGAGGVARAACQGARLHDRTGRCVVHDLPVRQFHDQPRR